MGPSDYVAFAWAYNRYWGSMFMDRALPALERLVFTHLPRGASVLDVGCGTGQLAGVLLSRGFRVTGLDRSAEMIRFARENAPGATFLVADARSFRLPRAFHAALSTFDTLNHIPSLEELAATFCNVHAALVPGGLFLFDLNMEEGYLARWRGGDSVVARTTSSRPGPPTIRRCGRAGSRSRSSDAGIGVRGGVPT